MVCIALVFLADLGLFFSSGLFLLICFPWVFPGCREQGLLIAAVSLVEHRLQAHGCQYLQHAGSGFVTRGLSDPVLSRGGTWA